MEMNQHIKNKKKGELGIGTERERDSRQKESKHSCEDAFRKKKKKKKLS
jgi:hypothetical protein